LRIDYLFDGTELEISVRNSRVIVEVTGVDTALVEIGEQFAWLGAACQAPSTDEMRSSTAKISWLWEPDLMEESFYRKRSSGRSSGADFNLTFSLEGLESDEGEFPENGTCWYSLFRNSVLVKGFPILARKHKEKGLEIPLNMMAGLGEASRATNFDGSLVIKGFSTMFVPTGRTQNQSRISYLCARERCSNQVLMEIGDALLLESTRHFVGWASSAVTRTGKSRHELRIFHSCFRQGKS